MTRPELVTITDPDAGTLARVRWRTGEGLFAAAVLGGLGALVVGGLTVFGAAAGLFWPVLGGSVGALVGGVLAQAGISQPDVTHTEMVVPVTAEEALPEAVRGLAETQQQLADALCLAWSALPEQGEGSPADEALEPVVLAARRVAYLAATDLTGLVTSLAPLVAGQPAADGGSSAIGEIAARQARVREAVLELERLTGLLGEGSAAPDRREAALEELTNLTDWVAHRREALRELGQRRPDGGAPEGQREPGQGST